MKMATNTQNDSMSTFNDMLKALTVEAPRGAGGADGKRAEKMAEAMRAAEQRRGRAGPQQQASRRGERATEGAGPRGGRDRSSLHCGEQAAEGASSRDGR